VSRLAFIKDHPALFESLQQSGWAEAAAGRLSFLNDHATLFAELEGPGLDSLSRWLRFVKEHSPLLAELESLGLTDSASRWLRFVKEHQASVGYLAARPTLADDMDRQLSRGGALPNVRMASKLLPGWILGKYRASREGP